MMLLAWLLAILAMLIAALGVLRLSDALSRQHAATKAATPAVTLLACVPAIVSAISGWGWVPRLLVMLAILFCVLPLASHALARAAVAESGVGEKEGR